MNTRTREELLDVCLQRLQMGEDPERILGDYPSYADELRPLLATAQLAGQAARRAVPASAQVRSRARFLAAAATPAPRRVWPLRLIAAAVASFLFVAGLVGTSLASAAALPGDALYPVKLVVERIPVDLSPDTPTRLEREEAYDQRRLAETSRLKDAQQGTPVTFSGYLNRDVNGLWRVGSLQLEGSLDEARLAAWENAYVEVSGASDGTRVRVASIDLRQMEWTGTLHAIAADAWTIGGVRLAITADTIITGPAAVPGAEIHVTVVRYAQDRYVARRLEVISVPPTRLPQATQTARPTQTIQKPTETEVEEVEHTVSPSSTRPAITSTRTPQPTEPPEKTKAPTGTRTPAPTQKQEKTEIPSATRAERTREMTPTATTKSR